MVIQLKYILFKKDIRINFYVEKMDTFNCIKMKNLKIVKDELKLKKE